MASSQLLKCYISTTVASIRPSWPRAPESSRPRVSNQLNSNSILTTVASISQVLASMPRNGGRPSLSLFVRNVAYDMTDDELKRVFLKYGHIRDVYVPKDYRTQVSSYFHNSQFLEPDLKMAKYGFSFILLP